MLLRLPDGFQILLILMLQHKPPHTQDLFVRLPHDRQRGQALREALRGRTLDDGHLNVLRQICEGVVGVLGDNEGLPEDLVDTETKGVDQGLSGSGHFVFVGLHESPK
jgi:hypothetical protein